MASPEALPPEDDTSFLAQLGFRTMAVHDNWFRSWKRAHGIKEQAPQNVRPESLIPTQSKLRQLVMRHIIVGELKYDAQAEQIEASYAHKILDARHQKTLRSDQPLYVGDILSTPQLMD